MTKPRGPRVLPRFLAVFLGLAVAVTVAGGLYHLRDLDTEQNALLERMDLGLDIRKSAVVDAVDALSARIADLAAHEGMTSLLSGMEARDLIMGEEGWSLTACFTELEEMIGEDKTYREVLLLDELGREILRLDPQTDGPVVAWNDTIPAEINDDARRIEALAQGEIDMWLRDDRLYAATPIPSPTGEFAGGMILAADTARLLGASLETGFGLPGQVILVDGAGRLLGRASGAEQPNVGDREILDWLAAHPCEPSASNELGLIRCEPVAVVAAAADPERATLAATRAAVSDWRIVSWAPAVDTRALLIDLFNRQRTNYLIALGVLALLSWLLVIPGVRLKRAMLAERASREQFSRILDSSSDIIITTEIIKGDLSRAVVTSINPAGAALFGLECFNEEEPPAIGDLIRKESALSLGTYLREVLQGSTEGSIEISATAVDGRPVTLDLAASVVSESGVPVALQAVARDVSDRKQTEERILEANDNLTLRSQTTQAIMAEGDLRNRLGHVLDILVSSREQIEGLIYVIDAEAKSARLVCVEGDTAKEFGGKYQELDLSGENICARTVAHQAPLLLNCWDMGDCSRRGEKGETAASYLSLPLNSAGDARGVMVLFSTTPIEWSQSLLDTCGQIGLVLGSVIHREKMAVDLSKRAIELEKAQGSARRETDSKSGFLSGMSQEIRTPLNNIVGLVELLLNANPDAQQRDYLLSLKNSAGSLLAIINDVLDLSSIEAGKLKFERVAFNLRETIRDSLNRVAAGAAEKGLTLKAEVERGAPAVVIGDPTRLSQVLNNLLGNAVKYTSRGEITAKVEVAGQPRDSVQLHFSVRDTGIGIPQDKHEQIFETFKQSDQTPQAGGGGSGLGLGLSQKLVTMMNGRIWVQSQPERGSTFHFTAELGLPESLASDRPAAPPAAAPRAAEPQAPAAPATPPPAVTLPPLNVLLAEDNEVNQKLTTDLLKRQGAGVTVVSTGIKAIEAIATADFDLVLMDVEMPELDGLAATRAIRDYEKGSGGHVPIIAMTAQAMKGQRERCLSAGMDSCIGKPVTETELTQAIAEQVMGVGRGSREPSRTAQDAETKERRGAGARRSPVAERKDTGMDDLSVFDRAAALDRVDGDLELLIELAGMFREDYPTMVKEIETSIADGDSETLQRSAHTLKGSVGNFSAQGCFDAAFKLETMGRNNEMGGASDALEHLKSELEKLESVLVEIG